MKTYFECIPCFLKQALEAARFVSDDEETHVRVLKEVMQYLTEISYDHSPPEISRYVHTIIKKVTDSDDPYKTVKDQSNETAKKLYCKLKEYVDDAEDPLLFAIKLAIIGNVIDFGSEARLDITQMIDKIDEINLPEATYHQFKEALDIAENIVYIGDNNGELYFDKLLLEILSKKVKHISYVVRAHPILNDVTYDDAKEAGIGSFADIIKGDDCTDMSAPGLLLEYASEKFLDDFYSADMIISKGQGNYESLSDENHNIFFLLVIKCPLIAREFNKPVGSAVFTVS